MDDRHWMRRALSLARRGWGRTSPNPMVGAVVVRDDRLLGSGWHHRAGQPHAEVLALAACTAPPAGATLYVTLEPCCTHGRTPPCTDAVLAAGIRRVVVATADPNPRHAGRGLEILRRHGVEVVLGVEEAASQELNEAFFCWIQHGRPFVLLKLGMTADGKIATAGGESQWITGTRSRARVQRLRQWADAIMVGGETVRQDNPGLRVRQPANWWRQPLRLVASQRSDWSPHYQVFADNPPAELVRCQSPAEWQAWLRELGRRHIAALLVEGGGELAASLLAAGVIDKVAMFIAPKLLGGRGSRPVIGGPNPASLAEALPLQSVRITASGEDFLLTGYLRHVHRYHHRDGAA